jgi:F0F1-type ATP synthase alpha subunit
MAILEKERKAVNEHAMDSYVGVEVQFRSLLKSAKQIKVKVSRYRPEQALGGIR